MINSLQALSSLRRAGNWASRPGHIPVSVQESLVETWVSGRLLQGWGHAYECLSQLSWQWPRRSQGLPTPPASWLPEAAATQAPGISAGPQAARLSPVAPRIHSRTSMALCLLAILPAFTLSLPKDTHTHTLPALSDLLPRQPGALPWLGDMIVLN